MAARLVSAGRELRESSHMELQAEALGRVMSEPPPPPPQCPCVVRVNETGSAPPLGTTVTMESQIAFRGHDFLFH